VVNNCCCTSLEIGTVLFMGLQMISRMACRQQQQQQQQQQHTRCGQQLLLHLADNKDGAVHGAGDDLQDGLQAAAADA
jgi:hypothetical protein